MATVTHIIRSHYDPANREELERETGQQVDDQSDPWQTVSSFSAQHRIRAAPTFVPAAISYDDWGVPLRTSSPSSITASSDVSHQPCTSTAEWYRSLTAASSSSRAPPPSRPSSAPSSRSPVSRPPQMQTSARRGKGTWFISKALRSEPATKSSSPVPAPSLADLLARDPPPLPSEGRYVPPVWLHIGPSNRGFSMLQRRGWNEGEGLGVHVLRSAVRVRDVEEDIEITPEIIDLSQSDSEAPEGALEDGDGIKGSVQAQATGEAFASHMPKSLLTPLPIVLKADRLGIGLKAKTEGPYKRSKRRVTHNAAALAAHIRAAEEVRRKKAAVGKGKRGFARMHKREEDARKVMLAYLNE